VVGVSVYSEEVAEILILKIGRGEQMSTAQGEPITAAAEHQLVGRSLSWWGMIFFITSEALIFANLIAAYLYLEIRNMGGHFAFRLPSGDYLDYVFPLINTFILLASSIPARFAGASIAKGNRLT